MRTHTHSRVWGWQRGQCIFAPGFSAFLVLVSVHFCSWFQCIFASSFSAFLLLVQCIFAPVHLHILTCTKMHAPPTFCTSVPPPLARSLAHLLTDSLTPNFLERSELGGVHINFLLVRRLPLHLKKNPNALVYVAVSLDITTAKLQCFSRGPSIPRFECCLFALAVPHPLQQTLTNFVCAVYTCIWCASAIAPLYVSEQFCLDFTLPPTHTTSHASKLGLLKQSRWFGPFIKYGLFDDSMLYPGIFNNLKTTNTNIRRRCIQC